MKKIHTLILLLGAAAVLGCNKSEKEFVTTDKGPRQTVSYSPSALMGSEVGFSVDLQDEIALSTLKVKLLFDETVVADTTIRTKTPGTYEGYLKVPFLKNIPDGVATLRVTSQNIQFGLTEEDFDVAVSRPDFDYLTLEGENGQSYRMERIARNQYAVTDAFPGEMNAQIVSAPFDSKGRQIRFGFSANSGIDPEASGMIPFTGVGSRYEISLNTLTFEGAPFMELAVNGVQANMASKNNYVAVLNLSQGSELTITGLDFTDWMMDPDFLEEQSAGVYKFLAKDGLYRVNIQVDTRYFLIERMASTSDYATIDTHAVWMIGEQYGKPFIFSETWNTDRGLCLAEVADNVYQITLIAGLQLGVNSMNVKFFHQKGWGGEFGGSSYAAVRSDLIYTGESDGNIHLNEGVSLEQYGIYRFTLDLSGGADAAILDFEKVGAYEYEAPAFAVNGVEFTGGPTVFEAQLPLSTGAQVKITELDQLADYWWDPDFFSDGRFAAVDGEYKIRVDTGKLTIGAIRVTQAGAPANLEEGGLYIQGWGIAGAQMTAQVGWPGAGGYQLAQVRPGVFQFTGLAVAETDERLGGRFRTDYANFKWFFQDGWGGEASKGVTISGNAADRLSQGDDGNMNLVPELEEGATYRLTIDFSAASISGASITAGMESVVFEKL